jgi:hypothetical protein
MGKPDYREMRVAHIRERKEADYVEVMFLESARIYKLPKKNSKCDEILRLLRDAIARERVVKVRFTSPESDVIEDVQGS